MSDRSGSKEKALAYLDRATARGTRFPPTPIGFYFANLWYFEKLYPIIFTVAALERCGYSGLVTSEADVRQQTPEEFRRLRE